MINCYFGPFAPSAQEVAIPGTGDDIGAFLTASADFVNTKCGWLGKWGGDGFDRVRAKVKVTRPRS